MSSATNTKVVTLEPIENIRNAVAAAEAALFEMQVPTPAFG